MSFESWQSEQESVDRFHAHRERKLDLAIAYRDSLSSSIAMDGEEERADSVPQAAVVPLLLMPEVA
jgi:hypothetical protein